MKAAAAPDKFTELAKKQKEGGRTFFDAQLLRRQNAGEDISQAALAQSLQVLLNARKPNQKLAVTDISVNEKTVKVLYLIDRSSNPIERRIFKPGLLNKLASRDARNYIEKEIGINYSVGEKKSSQIHELTQKVGPIVAKAQRRQDRERAALIDPRRKITLDIKKAKVRGDYISFGSDRAYEFSQEDGGFSDASNEIRLVTDKNGKKYVLKKIQAGERSKNELKLLQDICKNAAGKRHVMEVRDIGANGDHYYVTMEYMDGPDCSKLIEKMKQGTKKELSKAGKRGFLLSRDRVKTGLEKNAAMTKSLEDRTYLFCEVAKAVNVLSERGITHNDLKWENILFDSKLGPRVADLELAKLKNEKIIKGVKLRDNPRLKPPEILEVENSKFDWANPGSKLTPASDVWSLGIMLCELLLDVNPFDRDRTQFSSDIENRIAKHGGILNPDLFDGLPIDRRASFENLISSMLDPKPKNRPTIDEVLKHRFFGLCQLHNSREKSQMHAHFSAISGGTGWAVGEQQRRNVQPQGKAFQQRKQTPVIGADRSSGNNVKLPTEV